ncbi:MAG: hypothetical protein ACRDRL_09205 [Sciscionella sp.]
MKQAGIDPVPERAASTWADFLRSQAHALLAAAIPGQIGMAVPAPRLALAAAGTRLSRPQFEHRIVRVAVVVVAIAAHLA